MKCTAVIQARMGSGRLPGKVLFPLGRENKPSLVHLIERIKRAKQVDEILIVTTCRREDKIIEEYGKGYGCKTYAGTNKYVLDNILDACEIFNIDTIVDVTADCPLIDPGHIDVMTKFYKQHKDKFTYVSNVINRAYPRGFDLQIYSALTLRLFADTITDLKHRNHSGWNIMIRESCQRQFSFIYGKPYQDWRLCIDEETDYKLMQRIFNKFRNNKFSAQDVISYLERNRHLLEINKKVKQKVPGRG